MISQLLDEPYIKPLIDSTRPVWTSSKDFTPETVLVLTIEEAFLTGASRPFVYGQTSVSSQEDFDKFFDAHAKSLEDHLFYMIFFYSPRKSLGRTEFYKLSFIEKLNYLDIPQYGSDRNVMDLFFYYELIRLTGSRS